MNEVIIDGFSLVDGARLASRAEFLIGLPNPSRWNLLEYAVAYAFADMADRAGLIEDFHPPTLVRGGHILAGLNAAWGQENRLNPPTFDDSFTISALARMDAYLTSIGYLAWRLPVGEHGDETGATDLHLALPVDRVKIRTALLSEMPVFRLLDDEPADDDG
ncbi:hypothetical protein ACQEVF_57080 [Nonomuraea polychroma]|uniref:hypothetical protein n=1 Tax=Nonomuraea polychroma TaxID=46176 RepID=UPI003D8DA1A2